MGSGASAKQLQVDRQGYAAVQHLGDSEVKNATLNEPSLYYRYNGLSSLTLQVKLKKGTFHAVREGRRVIISGLFYPYSTATQLNSSTPAAFNFKKPNAGGGLLLYYDAANSSHFERLFTFGSSNSTLFPQHIALLRGEIYSYTSTYKYLFARVENLYLHSRNRILYIRLLRKDAGLFSQADVNISNLIIDLAYCHLSDNYL